MEVHVYTVLFELILLLIEFGHTTANTKTIEMCRYCIPFSCKTCNANIKCDIATKIEIIKVEYRDNSLFKICGNCGGCCYTELQSSMEHTESIIELCDDQHTCNLGSWNSDKKWKMKITYICNESPMVSPSTTTAIVSVSTSILQTTSVKITELSHKTTEITDSSSPLTETTDSLNPKIETTDSSSPQTETTDYSSSTAVKSSPHLPEQSNGSSRMVRTKDEETANFPVGAAVAIPVGIVVMILVIVGIVCVVRRKSNGAKVDKQIEGNTLPMQDRTDNNNDNPPPSGNREDLQDAHEQEYVDTTSHRGTLNITCDTVEQEYVDTNPGGLITTEDDEYNTLNTHQAHLQTDPNYDHLPKHSHTTVDETYSHVTEGQTAVPDATYSHLQESKSNSSHNAKSDQNNSDNVYNHINGLSVDDNVYNNIQTNFTQNPTSNLTQTRAEEDDYDHTDWKQAKSSNPIASTNGVINRSDAHKLTAQADDEYAVVNMKSDKVESNEGHNYFVLEKQSF